MSQEVEQFVKGNSVIGRSKDGHGRAIMVDTARVDGILKRHNSKRENMIAILIDCQEHERPITWPVFDH